MLQWTQRRWKVLLLSRNHLFPHLQPDNHPQHLSQQFLNHLSWRKLQLLPRLISLQMKCMLKHLELKLPVTNLMQMKLVCHDPLQQIQNLLLLKLLVGRVKLLKHLPSPHHVQGHQCQSQLPVEPKLIPLQKRGLLVWAISQISRINNSFLHLILHRHPFPLMSRLLQL